MLKTTVLLINTFVETRIFFFQDYLMDRQLLFETVFIFNFVKVFTVTFDQFN